MTFGKRLLRGLRFLALCLGVCLLAAGVSYGTVRYLTRNLHVVPTVAPHILEQSRILRSLNNELVLLCDQYVAWFESGDAPHKTSFKRWNEEVFQTGIAHLRMRLDVLPYEDNTFRLLKNATERAATMSGHPGDRRLQEQALNAVRRCAESTEAFIRDANTDRYLGEPVHRPRF